MIVRLFLWIVYRVRGQCLSLMFQLLDWLGWMRPARTACLYSCSACCWRWIFSMTVSISGEGVPVVMNCPLRCALFSILLVWQRWEQKSSGSGHFDQLSTGGWPGYHLVIPRLVLLRTKFYCNDLKVWM